MELTTRMGKIWELTEYNDRPAFIDEFGNQITYSELFSGSNSLTNVIGHRCLVFLLCRNEIGSALGYISFLNHGMVPVMLNSHLEKALLKNLLETYFPEYIWMPIDQREHFPEMDAVYSANNYVLLKTGYARRFPLYDELGILITTSGSTGSAKLVRQSYVNILDNAKSIAEYLELDSDERPITTLPMNYVYGLSIINSHLLVGATILLTDRSIMQKEFWDFLKNAWATSFGGVPYTYEMLDKLGLYRMNLPTLKTMTQAGGKLTPELQEKFAKYATEHRKNFVVMYGAAEATARMGYLPAEKAVEKRGAMGIPIPGGMFTLISVNGEKITTPHTTGELVYEGKNVTLGYAEKGEDLILGDERHGRLETGDLAQFDEDGYYYIVGRKKRFLKIYGNRVNLDEIERILKTKYQKELACGGKDDHLVIFVTDPSVSKDAISFISGKTKLNPAAFSIKLLDEIPKNDSGKIMYKELEKYC